MGAYFLDTSALVKRYVAEVGHQWVEAICASDADHTILISQAALVEAVATFCRKARDTNIGQRIVEADRDRAITLFRRDARRHSIHARVTSAFITDCARMTRCS